MGLRFRFGLRARILRAKLKHNISASTRNSISREGGTTVELVHRPPSLALKHLAAGSSPPPPSISWPHQFDRCLILLESFELYRRYSSVDMPSTRTYVNTNVRLNTSHHRWKGSWTLGGMVYVCVCVSVWPRDQQTTRVNIFGAYVTSDLGFSHDRFKAGLLSRLAVFVVHYSSNHLLIRELCCAMERDF